MPIMNSQSESEISLNSIADHFKDSFDITRGNFSEKVFGYQERISRIIKYQAEHKITDKQYQIMFDYIKEESGGSAADFIEKMHEWFPELSKFKTEKAIIRKVRSELEREAIDDNIILLEDTPANLSTIEFVRFCTKNISSIKNLYLAAQTGWEWHDNKELNSVLTELSKSGKHIVVITNPETETTKNIADATKDEKIDLRYMSLNDTLARWHKYEERYRNIELRVSLIPFLHQTVMITLEGNTAYALVKDYIYGSPVGCTSPRIFKKDKDSDFDHFYKEFSYLRNRAKSYTEWLKSEPVIHEEMPTKDYVLLYPVHKDATSNMRCWVFSALTVHKNNSASLKVNMSDSYKSFNQTKPCEYEYHGKIKLSGKMIFFTMTDAKQTEHISISFTRPIKDNDSFIGVLTGLSPGGVPVSYKCACFSEEVLSQINYENLFRLLAINNTEFQNNLIKIDSDDIDEFYSDRIFE